MIMNANLETLRHTKNIVDALAPGYYRRAINPFETLENGQGNCFTNAVIGAVALSSLFEVEASLVWSNRLHASQRSSTSNNKRQPIAFSNLNIVHIELVMPRGLDQYDILALATVLMWLTAKVDEAYTKKRIMVEE
jgi:hypothetical protein